MMAAHENAELHNLLGNVEERAGNFAGADPEYERAAHMAPTEEHLFDWGNNLLQLQAFEDAAKVFTPAIARHPRSARLHVGLGIAQYSRGQYEDAVKSFCQAADLAPADPRPYQFLGEMYGVAPAMGEEITRRLARFAKAQPRNAQAQFHYAMSLWKGQPAGSPSPDLRQVEGLLRRAVTLDVKFAKAFLELGILLSDQQRYTEAIQELRHATRLAPDLAQAHYRLSQAYSTDRPDGAGGERARAVPAPAVVDRDSINEAPYHGVWSRDGGRPEPRGLQRATPALRVRAVAALRQSIEMTCPFSLGKIRDVDEEVSVADLRSELREACAGCRRIEPRSDRSKSFQR